MGNPIKNKNVVRTFLIAVTLLLGGCAEHGSWKWGLVPQFVITRSDTLSDRLLKDPRSLRDKLAAGLSSSTRTRSGLSYALRTLQLEQWESLALLIDSGADLASQDSTGNSFWFHAITAEDPMPLHVLVGHASPEPAAPPDLAEAMRHLASHSQDLLTRKLPLLKQVPLDWNVPDATGMRASDIMVLASREAEMSDLLQSSGQKWLLHASTVTALLDRAGREPLTTLVQLLQSGLDPDTEDEAGYSLLSAAVEARNVEALGLLLDHGAARKRDVSSDPLVRALLTGQSGVAIELVRQGINPEKPAGSMMATDAAEMMLDSRFLEFLARTVPPANRQLSPYVLRELSRRELLPVEDSTEPQVTQALKKLQTQFGLYPSGYVSQLLNEEAERNIVQYDAAISVREGDMTALEEISARHTDYLQQPDSTGWTTLMHAAYFGQRQAVERLLELGNVNARDQQGSNALLLALLPNPARGSDREQVRIAELLLNAGARNEPDSRGAYPSDLVRRYYPHVSDDFPRTKALLEFKPNVPGYIAVLGRPSPGRQQYQCFPNSRIKAVRSEWISKNWDDGLRIDHAARFGNEWCVVMGRTNNPDRAENILFAPASEWAELIAEMEENKRFPLSLDTASAIRMIHSGSAMRGHSDGRLTTPTARLKKEIKENIWDKGWNINRVGVIGDEWVLVYGEARGLRGAQSWVTTGSLEGVLEYAQERWQEGKHITGISRFDNKWLVVMTEGSGLREQKFLVSLDREQFEMQLADHMKAGWGINHLLSENVR